MFPVICQIGVFKVYSYFAAIIVAAVVAVGLFYIDLRRNGFSLQKSLSLIIWPFLCGTLGLRLYYIILNFKYFVGHPAQLLDIKDGGFLWHGALIFGTATLVLITRIERVAFRKIADIVAPYLALNQAIARFGCYLNGCCFGKEVIWGVYVPRYDKIFFPRQLFLIVGHVIIFCLLKRWKPKGKFAGQIFISFLILDTLLKFTVDFFSR